MQNQETIETFKKDLKAAALAMTKQQVRYLVDAYYAMQENRIRCYAQKREADKSGEPGKVMEYLAVQAEDLETLAKKALDYWSADQPVGKWLRSITGIGPVIAAGLLAHTDIEKCKKQAAGAFWAFAGYDPTRQWEKGEKRPWNAAFKTLCWKVGESFVKVSGLESDFYGKLIIQRKEYELAKNEKGDYAEQAAAVLKTRPNHAQAKIYKQGKLPPGHIHARAKRWAVKLFLAHFFEVYYRHHFKTDPPLPYPIAHKGHTHRIPPPNGESHTP